MTKPRAEPEAGRQLARDRLGPSVPAHLMTAVDRAVMSAAPPWRAPHPVPVHLRQALDSPLAKLLANAKPPFDGPPHPALDPKNALNTGDK